jgi:hypothetical protein
VRTCIFHSGPLFSKLRLYIAVSTSVIFLSSVFFVHLGFSQCDSIAGPNTPGATADQSFPGSSYTFSNPSFVSAADGSSASAAAFLGILSGKSDYILASNFNFSIPPGMTICGIKVEIKKSATGIGILSSVQDYKVSLIKNGVILDTNRATNSDWTSTNTFYTYGGVVDSWGTTWSLADINSSTFGVAVSAKLNGVIALVPSARIDNIRVTLYYDNTAILPVQISYFTVQQLGDRYVHTSWGTGNLETNTDFIVERSADGNHWDGIDTVIAAAESSPETTYDYTDIHPLPGESFYRVVILRGGSPAFISQVRPVNILPGYSMKIYPNPSPGFLFISDAGTNNGIRITDIFGRLCASLYDVPVSGVSKINIHGFQPGVYFVIINNTVRSFIKK